MLNRKRHSHFARLICFLMALHFLNYSIDPRDLHPDSHPEDLKFNDIETITELLAEVILEKKNVFEEHEEKDNYDGNSSANHKFYYTSLVALTIHSPQALSTKKFTISNTRFIQSLSTSVTSPPPKIAILS